MGGFPGIELDAPLHSNNGDMMVATVAVAVIALAAYFSWVLNIYQELFEHFAYIKSVKPHIIVSGKHCS